MPIDAQIPKTYIYLPENNNDLLKLLNQKGRRSLRFRSHMKTDNANRLANRQNQKGRRSLRFRSHMKTDNANRLANRQC